MEENKIKIIFLDIDGVLNSVKSMTESDDRKWSDEPSIENIGWLNLIIEKTDAKIVISSTWRHGNHASLFDRYFHALGIIGEVIDITPRLDSYRGAEIKCWLIEHASKIVKYKDSQWCIYKEPIESFVIIDDDSDMEDLIENLVLVDNKTGLSKENAEKAIKILNNA
jgi:hypothetical protein